MSLAVPELHKTERGSHGESSIRNGNRADDHRC